MTIAIDRHAKVIGPPGTGKTHTLLELAEKAVKRHGPDRVVVASYTKKAAAEIRARGGPNVPDHVGTVHSLAIRALSARGDRVEILQDRFGQARFLEDSPQWAEDLEELQNELDYARTQGSPCSTWNARLRSFSLDWMLYLEEQGGTDFYGLLERATREEALPCESPAVVFHDEAQDATRTERAYLDCMVRAGAVLIEFGDPLQTLYQFRGACPKAFEQRLGAAEHLLAQSYRVPRQVLELARAWMGSHGVDLPPYMPRPADGQVRLQRGSAASNDPEFADRVVDTVNATGSMMVLAPTRRGVQGLLTELQARGFPYGSAAHKGRPWSPLRDPMACRVADLLAPILEGRPGWTWTELQNWTSLNRKSIRTPEYQKRKKWPVSPLGAPSRHALREVLTTAAYELVLGGCKTAVAGQEGRFSPRQPALRAWTALSDQRHLPPENQERPASPAPRVSPEKTEKCERLLAAVLDLAETRPYTRALGEYLVRVATRHGIEYLRGKPPALHVSTLHSAKGGEADVVWLSDNLGPQFARNRRTLAGLEAVRNMLYVGVTRARHELAILDQARHSVCLARFVTQ